MNMPFNILFWGMEAAYFLHCFEEVKMGFVNFVKENFWSGINHKNFYSIRFLVESG